MLPTASPPSSTTTTKVAAATSTGLAVRELKKNPIVIFPAQFGVAKDYEELIEELNQRGHPAKALDLSRFDWLKITKSIATPEYWSGNLQPKGSLDFYFEAADKAIAELKAEYPNKKIHLLAHSIGGWIARAYCGEVADPADVSTRFVSLTTLGSPHYPPSGEGVWASVDQTRGLLRYVDENFPGAYHKNFKYVSVGGVSTPGKIGGGIEESVAYISYLPLCGNGETVGDGIIPEEIAFLEGAVHVRVPDVKHSSFIPTAGPSIKIPNYRWYGTPDVVDQWIVHLPESSR